MRFLAAIQLYRPLMKLAHHFNWHYAPPVYPEGDTQLWCQWCGFRQTIKRRTRTIDELEKLLHSEEDLEIHINPDGSIRADKKERV